MLVIETHIFRRQIDKLLNYEEYRIFQNYIMANYKFGDVIKGSGGIRKIRWGKDKKGKRGGIRVLYYYVVKSEVLLLLLAYSKSESDDLSKEQLKILKKIVKEELEDGR